MILPHVNVLTHAFRVQDAWNTALAIETGCEWMTTDRGNPAVGAPRCCGAIEKLGLSRAEKACFVNYLRGA